MTLGEANMNTYQMEFLTSGNCQVKANSLNEAFDKITERFRRCMGSNQTKIRCLKINGQLVEDERKGSNR